MPSSIISSIAGSVISSAISGGGSNKAAKAQTAAADAATQLQRDIYNQNREDQMPWLKSGGAARNQLSYLLGLNPTDVSQGGNPQPLVPPAVDPMQSTTTNSSPNSNGYYVKDGLIYDRQGTPIASPNSAYGQSLLGQTNGASTPTTATAAPASTDPYANVNTGIGGFGSLSKPFGIEDFHKDPGYDFAMSEGQKALERSAAAKGQLLSGATLKATDRFSQGLADQQYGTAFDRYNTNQTNLYNRLAGVSGSGQTAASNLTSAGQNYANSASDIALQRGNAQAAGIVGQTNAWNTGLASIGNAVSNSSFNPSAFANGFPWCDIRLKENLVPAGLENGWPLYEFNYINIPQRYIGVIAQDVFKIRPDAVVFDHGFMRVDTKKIGVEFREASCR